MASTRSALDAYEVIGHLGKGSFGIVSKIIRKADRRTLVWKELNYGSMREKEKQLVVSEVNILRELRHPFIVRYYDRIIDKSSQKLYIVMEYCEGGDLGALIKKCRRDGTQIDEDFIWRVFTQLIVAIKDCHRHRENGILKPILHRDIKPCNIFLDGSRSIKIGDFGLAKELASQSKFATTNVGTPFYMSPEMVNETKYNEKSDIWAVGCLIYELAALRPPFEATNQLTLAVKINSGKFPRIPLRYSDDLHRLIRWMLQKDISKRPSVDDLQNLPRMSNHVREATLTVKEHQMQQSYASKFRELARREEELKRKEATLFKREQAVKEKEHRLGIADGSDNTSAVPGHERRRTFGTLRDRNTYRAGVNGTGMSKPAQPPPAPSAVPSAGATTAQYGALAPNGGCSKDPYAAKRPRRPDMVDVTGMSAYPSQARPTVGQL